jgi:hypothetical protein
MHAIHFTKQTPDYELKDWKDLFFMQPGGGFEMTTLTLRRDAEFGKGMKIRCPDSRAPGQLCFVYPSLCLRN